MDQGNQTAEMCVSDAELKRALANPLDPRNQDLFVRLLADTWPRPASPARRPPQTTSGASHE